MCVYSARGLLGVICWLACSSSWSAERKDLTLSERRDNITAQVTLTELSRQKNLCVFACLQSLKPFSDTGHSTMLASSVEESLTLMFLSSSDMTEHLQKVFMREREQLWVKSVKPLKKTVSSFHPNIAQIWTITEYNNQNIIENASWPISKSHKLQLHFLIEVKSVTKQHYNEVLSFYSGSGDASSMYMSSLNISWDLYLSAQWECRSSGPGFVPAELQTTQHRSRPPPSFPKAPSHLPASGSIPIKRSCCLRVYNGRHETDNENWNELWALTL